MANLGRNTCQRLVLQPASSPHYSLTAKQSCFPWWLGNRGGGCCVRFWAAVDYAFSGRFVVAFALGKNRQLQLPGRIRSAICSDSLKQGANRLRIKKMAVCLTKVHNGPRRRRLTLRPTCRRTSCAILTRFDITHVNHTRLLLLDHIDLAVEGVVEIVVGSEAGDVE